MISTVVDIERASEFMRTHARLLDRRRFELLFGDGSAGAALAALSGYRNPDGGFGSAVRGAAHRVAEHDPAVAGHPWLEAASDYCMKQIATLREAPFAIAFRYVLQFLDAVHGKRKQASDELARLGELLPESGTLPVPGGAEGERMTPLDISPRPGRPLRALLSAEAIAADLDRLAAGQTADGGWEVDFNAFSPAARLEWRGYMTVWALTALRANGRLAD